MTATETPAGAGKKAAKKSNKKKTPVEETISAAAA